jgi:hypothetical protein
VFTVDGKVRRVDRKPPFLFSWSTNRAKPGRHVVAVVATSIDHRTATRRIPLVVPQPPKPKPRPKPKPPVVTAPRILGQSLADGQEVSGLAVWRVDVAGQAEWVEFWIDGELRGTDLQRPFTLGWDTAAETPGEHRLEARAVGANAREARAPVTVTVVVAAPAP